MLQNVDFIPLFLPSGLSTTYRGCPEPKIGSTSDDICYQKIKQWGEVGLWVRKVYTRLNPQSFLQSIYRYFAWSSSGYNCSILVWDFCMETSGQKQVIRISYGESFTACEFCDAHSKKWAPKPNEKGMPRWHEYNQSKKREFSWCRFTRKLFLARLYLRINYLFCFLGNF